jgi:hypothetical protein
MQIDIYVLIFCCHSIKSNHTYESKNIINHIWTRAGSLRIVLQKSYSLKFIKSSDKGKTVSEFYIINKTDFSAELYRLYQGIYIFHYAECKEYKNTIELYASLYENIDYAIDWINKLVILNTPLAFVSQGVSDILRIDVYEVGNGDQLVKASTKTDPIRINSTTGFQEIYLNANYSAGIFQGSGIMRPQTSPIYVNAIQTDGLTNTITCTTIINTNYGAEYQFLISQNLDNQILYITGYY